MAFTIQRTTSVREYRSCKPGVRGHTHASCGPGRYPRYVLDKTKCSRNRFTVAALPLLWCAFAAAQNGPSPAQFIASRQTEVERLAKALFSTQLNDGTWARHELPSCVQLPHHAFARFDETPASGPSAHFLAIYDLSKAPARPADKPWRGGILLLRVHPPSQNHVGSVPAEASFIEAFNRVLQQERAAQPQGTPDNFATANCFLRIAGNEPMAPDPKNGLPETQDATATPIVAVVLPLKGDAGFLRSQYVKFDERGLITEAGIDVQPATP